MFWNTLSNPNHNIKADNSTQSCSLISMSSLASWFHRSTAEFDVYSRPWPTPNSFRLLTHHRCLILSWQPFLTHFLPKLHGEAERICASVWRLALYSTKILAADLMDQIFQFQPKYIFHFYQSERVWSSRVKLAWRQRIAAVIHAWPSPLPWMGWAYERMKHIASCLCPRQQYRLSICSYFGWLWQKSWIQNLRRASLCTLPWMIWASETHWQLTLPSVRWAYDAGKHLHNLFW